MSRKPLMVMLLLGILIFQPFSSLLLAAPSTQEQPGISSPRNGAVVRGVVSIVGTATHPEFWKYEIYYAPEPNPTDQWVFVGTVHETPVENGQLETWNTTTISDGVYSLRLRVVRRDGNYVEYTVTGIIVANATPTDTPTPEASSTPENTPTPPPPTPTPEIVQPPTATPRPSPTLIPATPTLEEDANPLPEVEVNTSNLGKAFCYGAGGTVATFGLLAMYAIIRTIVSWSWSLVSDRSRRSDQET
jgi:hypothetical protein